MLTLAWQPFKILPLVFIGFVPLLILEKKIRAEQENSNLWLFIYVWLSTLLWNIGTVWWIWNASEGGAIAAFIINSLPMVLPFLFYHFKNQKNQKENFSLLIAGWISVELLQFNWDLAFPWLQLGNVFSYLPQTVQWFEYTGVLGGSMWILICNVQVYKIYQIGSNQSKEAYRIMLLNKIFFYLLAPLFLSFYILYNRTNQSKSETGKFADIVLVQPNLDPYSEKFDYNNTVPQLVEMLHLAESKMDSLTQFVILPETALQGGLNEDQLQSHQLIQILNSFIDAHPNVSILTGMDSYKIFNDNKTKPITAHQLKNDSRYYDFYNAALFINKYDSQQVYHKSRLVPGVEKMPYPQVFGFIEKYAINLGGTSGSLGSDDKSKVFYNYHKIGLAPIICYESVFPEFVTTYVKQGAGVLNIITNDGWWGNTPGYRQHFDYARLRAIENRRYVSRSANTGISGFIDDKGNIIEQSEWWTETAMRMKVPVLNETTFYTTNGDLIAWFFLFVLGFELMSLWRMKAN